MSISAVSSYLPYGKPVVRSTTQGASGPISGTKTAQAEVFAASPLPVSTSPASGQSAAGETDPIRVQVHMFDTPRPIIQRVIQYSSAADGFVYDSDYGPFQTHYEGLAFNDGKWVPHRQNIPKGMLIHLDPLDWNFALVDGVLKSKREMSRHTDMHAWALGIDELDIQPFNGTKPHFGTNTPLNHAQLTETIKSTSENLDAKIASALQAGGITLGKNEVLSLSVNGQGGIIVWPDGNLGQERAASIQVALNRDASIGKDMLLSHLQRETALTRNIGYSGIPHDPFYEALLLETILDREWGLSLSDFTANRNYNWLDPNSYQLASKSQGDDFIQYLFENEKVLYDRIRDLAVSGWTDSLIATPLANIAYGFSYANGILVQNRVTDQQGMNRLSGAVAATAGLWRGNADFSVALDKDGHFVNAQVHQHVNGQEAAHRLELTLEKLFTAPDAYFFNHIAGENGIMNLLAFDSHRLFQFMHGPDAEGLQDFKVVLSGSINPDSWYDLARPSWMS